MARETTSGLGVYTQYGPRILPEGATGVIKTEGGTKELSISFSGQNINDQYLDQVFVLPANVRILSSYVEVEEAFVLGGTTPTINVGTDGSAATNGVSLDEAGAEALGTYTDGDSNVTINGTWATPSGLLAGATVSVELGGATPTVTAAGQARWVVEYAEV